MWSTHRWLKTTFGIVGTLLVGFAVFNYCRMYCRAPTHLTLSGGDACPLRSKMARNICSEVHDAGIVLESVPGANSEAICAAVDRGELDLALVQGGFPSGMNPNVRQVATFGVEPLHLLVRRELVVGQPNTLEMLRGRIVSLGEQGTNGALLAESLMRFAGLKPGTASAAGDFQAAYISERDLHVALRSVAQRIGREPRCVCRDSAGCRIRSRQHTGPGRGSTGQDRRLPIGSVAVRNGAPSR